MRTVFEIPTVVDSSITALELEFTTADSRGFPKDCLTVGLHDGTFVEIRIDDFLGAADAIRGMCRPPAPRKMK